MHDTFFVVPPEKRSRLARVHRHAPDGRLVAEAPMSLVPPAIGGPGFPSGSRGLISTADDYARFAQMLLNGGDSPGSAGRFGWTGAATTYCNVDPREGTIALVFAHHFPYDEFGLFSKFSTTFYQSLIESRVP